jgi:hypothetical protein
MEKRVKTTKTNKFIRVLNLLDTQKYEALIFFKKNTIAEISAV